MGPFLTQKFALIPTQMVASPVCRPTTVKGTASFTIIKIGEQMLNANQLISGRDAWLKLKKSKASFATNDLLLFGTTLFHITYSHISIFIFSHIIIFKNIQNKLPQIIFIIILSTVGFTFPLLTHTCFSALK